MADTKCTGDHSLHICELASQKKFQQIKNYTGSPGHVCVNCGRVANEKEHLCNPVSFAEILKDGVYYY
jgi:hypothetical protein